MGSVTHQRSYQCKTPCPKKDTDDKEEEEEEDEEEEEEEEEDGGKSPSRDEAASEAAAAATSRASSRASSVAAGVVLKEMEEMSGAETASEIFRHLQATTKDKTEVTTELAKILSVLETTLSKSKEGIRRGMQQSIIQRNKKPLPIIPIGSDECEESSSGTDEEEVAKKILERAAAAKKPPRHPGGRAATAVAAAAAAAASPKSSSADVRSTYTKKKSGDEMSILSKILVGKTRLLHDTIFFLSYTFLVARCAYTQISIPYIKILYGKIE